MSQVSAALSDFARVTSLAVEVKASMYNDERKRGGGEVKTILFRVEKNTLQEAANARVENNGP